jgi:hypothetical protein
MNNNTGRHTIVAPAAALCCIGAQDQLVDQFDVRRENDDAVLLWRVAAEVQFQRAVTTRAGDLTLVSYNRVTTVNSQVRATQGMRLGAAPCAHLRLGSSICQLSAGQDTSVPFR